MPPPITPLLRAGAQVARVAQQAARQASTVAPGLVQGALGAARRAPQNLGGLASRMSQLASSPAMQAAAARVQPRAMGALAQLQQMRRTAGAALENPALAAVQGVDRAAQVTSTFLQALEQVEHNAAFQRFAGPRLNAALHEAQVGLGALDNFLQSTVSFGKDANSLLKLLGGGGRKPEPPGPTPQASAVRPQTPAST